MLAARTVAGLKITTLPPMLTVPATAVPPVLTRVKLAVVSVEFLIVSENLADTVGLDAMPVAAFFGDVTVTVGLVVSSTVVVEKFQVKSAGNGFPATSFTTVVILAAYEVFAARAANGLNDAVSPLTLTVPATGVPSDFATRKLAVVNVEFIIGSEKTAVIEEFSATPEMTPGVTCSTFGAVVSTVVTVVKVHA